MTGSIWYRYRLDIRSRVVLVVILALWVGVSTTEWANPGWAAREMSRTPLAHSIGRESLDIWAAFANQMEFYAFVMGFFLVGTGLRTPFMRNHASVNYTLTLPVSRSRLIPTYQALNYAYALIAGAVTLAVRFAALWLRGDRVPFVPLTMSIAFATLFVIGWNAVLSALSMIMHEVWAMFIAFPIFLAIHRWTWATVTALPAYGEFPWAAVAALLTITGLALAIMLTLSLEQEFG